MKLVRLWQMSLLVAAVFVVYGCGQSPQEQTAAVPELRVRQPQVAAPATPPAGAPQETGGGISAERIPEPGTQPSIARSPGGELGQGTSVAEAGQPNQAMGSLPLAQEEDPFVVPDGPPEQIIQFLERLERVQPSATDEASLNEFRKKLATAVLTAAEKILSQAQVATEEQLIAAVQLKIIALTILSDVGDPDAAQTLSTFLSELEASGRAELARKARFLFLVQDLRRSGEMTDAEVADLAERIQKYLQSGPVEQSDAMLVLTLCQILESRQLNDLLVGLHNALAQQLAGSEDQQVRQVGKMVEGIARRAGLVGQPMEVSGVTLSGQPLDWQSYQGKVVLVTFWATWCGPCRREIPALLEAYESYHDQGFDIVAISVDDDRRALENFLSENQLPWMVLFDQEAPGEKMADKYGVMSIPQMILVGRDGKVVATGVRGHSLPEYLNKLIGPPPAGNMNSSTPPESP